jgi:hypothetical protein
LRCAVHHGTATSNISTWHDHVWIIVYKCSCRQWVVLPSTRVHVLHSGIAIWSCFGAIGTCWWILEIDHSISRRTCSIRTPSEQTPGGRLAREFFGLPTYNST